MNKRSVISDDAARSAALDVSRSFIVQAPAGSGKTELLIQRYLALLARVERPEAIVAMTFTRKAAGEIRERVVAALRDAASEAAPAEAHAAMTWRLARGVLQRDAALEWNLIAHPARLQVLTIDALCASLMRRAPLASKVGMLPRFVDRAQPALCRGGALGARGGRCRKRRVAAPARAPRQRRRSPGRSDRRHACQAGPVAELPHGRRQGGHARPPGRRAARRDRSRAESA